MSEYLLGLATLPALVVAFALVVWLSRPPHWEELGCVEGCPQMWSQQHKPHRPWWVWSVLINLHDARAGHLPKIRAWQAEHTVKRHWWSKREVVR